MSLSETISMHVSVDRGLVWQHGDSVRHIVIRVSAMDADKRVSGSRSRHNIAFVIDASIKMDFEMKAARELVTNLIADFDGDDRVSLVSFGDRPIVHVASCHMDGKGKLLVRKGLDSIQKQDGWRFLDGWLQGAECVARDMLARPDCVNRVFVLSNGGRRDAWIPVDELRRHSRELNRRNLPTTGIGIGFDTRPEALIAVDDRMGNWLQSAQTIEQMVDVIRSEYLETAPIVARDCNLEINAPNNVSILYLDKLVSDEGTPDRERRFGNLRAGADKLFVARLMFPPGNPGRRRSFTVTTRWSGPVAGRERQEQSVRVEFEYAEGSRNSGQQPDEEVAGFVIEAWKNAILSGALRLNSERRYAEAGDLIDRQLIYFERYCRDASGDLGPVRSLTRALSTIHRPWRA